MIELRDIYYIRLGTQDLDGAQKFATEIIGLQVVERTASRLYLKSGVGHHSVCYFKGEPENQVIAFELRHWTALHAALTQLQSAGVDCGLGTPEECRDRHVEGFLWFLDPTGNRIELVVRPHDAGVRYFASRDAGILSLGHVGLCSTDPVRDQDFWLTHFNAMVSDWIGPCPLLRVNERHHQMALFATNRKGIQHVNFQVAEIDDVMRSYYHMLKNDVKVVFGPGRHATSGGIFLYFEGHDGVTFEYSNSDRKIIESPENHRPRQFPLEPSSFCVWGAKPDIAEFKE